MKRLILASISPDDELMEIIDCKGNRISIDDISDESFYDNNNWLDSFIGVQAILEGVPYCNFYKSKGSGYQRGGDTEVVITRTPKTYKYYCDYALNNIRRKRFKSIDDIKQFLHQVAHDRAEFYREYLKKK